jgi:putative DNA primase/helicase
VTAPTEARPLLDTALAYAAHGWHVFPCQPQGKQPATAHGLHDATTDADQITTWWTRTPDANIAIATGTTSGLYVIDIDGAQGEATLEQLEATHGALPDTVQAITGGDGWHYLFTHPGGDLRNTAGKLGAGIDTRGDGGYIIAPPSVHPDGPLYEWAAAPDDVELAELPAWIVTELTAKPAPPPPGPTPSPPSSGTTPYAAKALEERAREVATAGEGTRNHTLNQAAFRLGQLVAGGQIHEEHARDTLEHAARTAGLDGREISATVRSGLSAGAQQPQYPDPTRLHAVAARDIADDDVFKDAAHTVDAPPPGRVADALADGFRGTDAGNADRFVAASDGHARYVHAWSRWIVYDPTAGVWRIDIGDALVTELAKTVARRMFHQAAQLSGDGRDALWKWAKRCESATAISNMVRLARGTPGVLVAHTDLDAQPWLLNVLNGTVDLRTGHLRPHDPDDLLTVQAPTRYDPDATAPLWKACLARWQPEPAMRAYLQQVIGTGTTGEAIEHLFVNLGPGGNGKSKFYGAVAHVLGDYVVIPHKSLITVQKHEQHDTIKARLFGARLAIASETDASDRLDEAKVKELTGGDLLEARRMREDPWKFAQTHTMVMHTNHRPTVRGVDEGVWRRIRLIPWEVTIPPAERDEQLAQKLEAESSGILNWILAGVASWREHGFDEPAAVITATTGYRASQDTLAAFLDEYTQPVAGHRVATKDLVDAYERWCESTGEPAINPTAFGRALSDRGYALSTNRRHRTGLRLIEPEANEDVETTENAVTSTNRAVVAVSQNPTRAHAYGAPYGKPREPRVDSLEGLPADPADLTEEDRWKGF